MEHGGESKFAAVIVFVRHDGSGYAFMDDIGRLIISSRTLHGNQLCWKELNHCRHEVYMYEEWWMETLIESKAASDTIEALECRLCCSCGLRPGESWLGFNECWECYNEHTER